VLGSEPADLPAAARLVCAECGETADEGADGWRAYFTDDEPKEFRTFCPDCAEREFGGP
jgi:ribosomal protein L44E